MITALAWIAIAANATAVATHIHLRHQLKRQRGQDAQMLQAAAHIVRCAGRGDYLDGTFANLIAEDLETQAVRALIIGGHYPMRELRNALRRHEDEDE